MIHRRTPVRWMAILGAAMAGPTLFGCASGPAARRPNVVPSARLRENPRLADGQFVFMRYCNQCHVGGAAGVGPSLNDNPIPPWLVKFQVREGLGAMPAFPKHVISDAQLDDMLHYLRYLREHPYGPRRA